ncbi:MAG: hypothetical protein V2A56_12450 [bacterium]
MKKWNLYLVPVLVLGLAISFTGCSKDDDNGTTPTEQTVEEQLVGEWLSAGDNVAVLLVVLFNYDSVLVTFGSDNTVTLNSHVNGGAWTGELAGVFSITESDTGSIHSISLNYTSFEQEGIIQLAADGDSFQLEAVQTVPDIGATVPTPEAGFGADVSLGTINIQTYVKQ